MKEHVTDVTSQFRACDVMRYQRCIRRRNLATLKPSKEAASLLISFSVSV